MSCNSCLYWFLCNAFTYVQFVGKSESKEVSQEDAKLIVNFLQSEFLDVPSGTWSKAFEDPSERVGDYM